MTKKILFWLTLIMILNLAVFHSSYKNSKAQSQNQFAFLSTSSTSYTGEKTHEVELTRIADADQEVESPIIELGILPRSSIYYEINLPRRVLVENIWQGYVEGDLTRIYAGRLFPDNRTGDTQISYHGAIYVTRQLSTGEIENHLRSTKEEVGSLTILNVNIHGQISLISNGYLDTPQKQIYFDIPSLQFTSSPDEIISPEAYGEEGYP